MCIPDIPYKKYGCYWANSSCGWKETREIKEERELNHLKATIQRDRNEQEAGGAVVKGTIFVITGGNRILITQKVPKQYLLVHLLEVG